MRAVASTYHTIAVSTKPSGIPRATAKSAINLAVSGLTDRFPVADVEFAPAATPLMLLADCDYPAAISLLGAIFMPTFWFSLVFSKALPC
jgi:hypothetical protein